MNWIIEKVLVPVVHVRYYGSSPQDYNSEYIVWQHFIYLVGLVTVFGIPVLLIMLSASLVGHVITTHCG